MTTPGKTVVKLVVVTSVSTGAGVAGLTSSAFNFNAAGAIYSGTPALYSVTPVVTDMLNGLYAIAYALPAGAGYGGFDPTMVSASYAVRPWMYSGETEAYDLTALAAMLLRQQGSSSAVSGLAGSIALSLVPYRYYSAISWTIAGVDLTVYSNFCLAFRDQTQKAYKIDMWFAAAAFASQTNAAAVQGNLTITVTNVGQITIALPRSLVGPSYKTWVASQPYSLGDRVVPIVPNGFVYICTTAGISNSGSGPTWPTSPNGQITDNTVTWTALAKSVWLASTPHAVGDYVTPQTAGTPEFGGIIMRCIIPGTTGSTEPTWPTTPSNPESASPGYQTDGGVTWQIFNDFYGLLTQGVNSVTGYLELTADNGSTNERDVITQSSPVTLTRWEVGT